MRTYTLLIAFALAICGPASAQSIFTVAGGGTDDGRPATAVSLFSTYGVAVDTSGNLYIVDLGANRVRKVTARTGLITTIAGNGGVGFSGDGGPATAATLSQVIDVAVDPSGNVYIADSNNSRVRKVDAATGIITTVAGTNDNRYSGDGGPATAAGLYPFGIAVDTAGNLYIADYNHRIRKVTIATGVITTVAGSGPDLLSNGGFAGDGGPATLAKLNSPERVAVDAAGNLYIADRGNLRVRKIDAASVFISTIAGNGSGGPISDGGPATATSIKPYGVAVDSAGTVYAADSLSGHVRKISAGNGVITSIPNAAAIGVAVDAAGDPYIAAGSVVMKGKGDTGSWSIVAGNGSSAFAGEHGPATSAALSNARGVALDPAGNLYVATVGRVFVVDAASRKISTVAGTGDAGYSGDSGPATLARIYASGIALDGSANLYISEFNNHRVRRVDHATGIISTMAGNGIGAGNTGTFSGDGGPATAAGLNQPYDVAVDAAGNLYIADFLNQRIRMVSAVNGLISTIAGNGTPGFSGDGGPATAAGLHYPYGIGLDRAGNLYVADLENFRVRKISTNGIISTIAGDGFSAHPGDFGPATQAELAFPTDVAVDARGNVYIVEQTRVRRIDANDGTIAPFAGNGRQSFSGDGGPAVAAGISNPVSIALDRDDRVFISENGSGRVREVMPCSAVGIPVLQQPAPNATGVSTAPKLAWTETRSAFHYDVYVDTVDPPQAIVATDVVAPAYSPSNLEPLTTYYWKVVAKGDPFCTPSSTGSSDVITFTTSGTCGMPGTFGVEATGR